MALQKLTFTKKWTNSDAETGFPTHEAQEAQVREDLQLLHDETATAFNKLIDDLKAGNISFAPTAGKITKTNTQEAVEFVYDEITKAAAGTIIDNSVTSDGLRKVAGEEAVTTTTIRNGAVTNDKLAGGITSDKVASSFWDDVTVADGTITNAKLANGAVKNKNIEQYTIEGDRLMNQIILNTHIADYDVSKQGITNDTGIGTRKLKDGAVSTEKLADLAVTNRKISSVEASKITGTITNSQLAGNIPFSKMNFLAVTTASVAVGTSSTDVKCQGVTANSTIIVAPHPDSLSNWRNYGVCCVGQKANAIVLKADVATTVKANVLIFN